jgi:hypothetical protein
MKKPGDGNAGLQYRFRTSGVFPPAKSAAQLANSAETPDRQAVDSCTQIGVVAFG